MEHLEKQISAKIGQRLRQRRQALGLSQQKVASFLGITFQQVQKYENGSNRVSAAKLELLSKFLKIGIGYFYDDFPAVEATLTFEERGLLTCYRGLTRDDRRHLCRTAELLRK